MVEVLARGKITNNSAPEKTPKVRKHDWDFLCLARPGAVFVRRLPMRNKYGFPFDHETPEWKRKVDRANWAFVILLASYVTAAILIWFFAFVPKAHATEILTIAQSQIGNGEMFGNNQGMYVRQYLNGRENLPWCAGFVSYCAKKSGLDVPYTLRAKDFLKLGKRINKPVPNCIVVFTRQGGGHVGIVEKINKDNFVSIEGNVGDYPAKVKRVTHKLNEKTILGFVQINRKG